MSINQTLTCPHCKSDWVIRVHRSLLERLFHQDEKKYVCEQCSLTFYLPQSQSAPDNRRT